MADAFGGASGDIHVEIRPAQDGDFHFVLSAWMQSYRDAQRSVNNPAYFHGQQNLIVELARRRQLIVACEKAQPDYLYGFACGVPFADKTCLIDYVYVKHMYRGKGIAGALVAKLGYTREHGAVVTHVTASVRTAIRARYLTYNPYYNALGFSDV